MSADTHTTAPRHGATDERFAAASRQSRLVEEFPSGGQPAVAATGEGMLAWAEDSRTMPVIAREQPRLRQIMGVCGWAAILGVVGLAVGIRGLIADLMSEAPGWYEPMMIGVGLTGIALTVGAFVSVHRRRTPYILLGAATVVLGYAIFLTAQAL
jgi:hypothetical protein